MVEISATKDPSKDPSLQERNPSLQRYSKVLGSKTVLNRDFTKLTSSVLHVTESAPLFSRVLVKIITMVMQSCLGVHQGPGKGCWQLGAGKAPLSVHVPPGEAGPCRLLGGCAGTASGCGKFPAQREREGNSFRGLARRVDALGKGQALPKKHPDGGCLRGVFVLGS